MTQEVFDTIRKRRTVRKFTDQEVSQEQIDLLLEMAMYAPNRLNRQPWHFIVIQDQGMQKQFADFLRIHSYLEDASAVIVACAMPKVSPTWAMDVSAAVENMMVGATALGLGSVWVGAFDENDVRRVIGVDDGLRPVAILSLGYAAEAPLPTSRRALEDLVHEV